MSTKTGWTSWAAPVKPVLITGDKYSDRSPVSGSNLTFHLTCRSVAILGKMKVWVCAGGMLRESDKMDFTWEDEDFLCKVAKFSFFYIMYLFHHITTSYIHYWLTLSDSFKYFFCFLSFDLSWGGGVTSLVFSLRSQFKVQQVGLKKAMHGPLPPPHCCSSSASDFLLWGILEWWINRAHADLCRSFSVCFSSQWWASLKASGSCCQSC